MAWTVTLYRCEWGGRTFHVPVWAIISENVPDQDQEPLRMDTSILWGHRYIHHHLATGTAIDIDVIEAQAHALEMKYSEAPVKLSSEESELGQKVFELLCKVAMVNNFDSVLDPSLNVLTANRWAEPIAPELPELVQPWSARSDGHLQEGASPPDIGFVHLKHGNVRAITLGRDSKTRLLRAVTLQDHEPDEVPFEDYLWRYSLLLIPDIAFTPDHSKFNWMQLWMHTRFFWSAYLDIHLDIAPSVDLCAKIAVATSQTLGEGLPLFELETRYPHSAVLGRPAPPTKKDFKVFDEACKADATIDHKTFFPQQKPTDAVVATYVEKLKGSPVPFTEEEMDLLGQLISLRHGAIHISKALRILAAWRWERPSNVAYNIEVSEQQTGKATSLPRPNLALPAEGSLVLPCSEVPVIAINRDPGTGRLRVVTLEASDQTSETFGFEICKYNVFDIDDSAFRPDACNPLVPGIRDEAKGTA